MNIAIGKSPCAAIVSLLLLLWPVTCNTFATEVQAPPQKTMRTQPEVQVVYYVAATYPDQASHFQATLAPSAKSDASVYRDVEPWTLVIVVLVLIAMRLLRVRQKGLPAIG